MLDQGIEIGSEGVVIVTAERFARKSPAPSVIRDNPVTRIDKGRHLPFPGPTVQRIAVDQNHGLPAAVILEVEIDFLIVLGTYRDKRHKHSFVLFRGPYADTTVQLLPLQVESGARSPTRQQPNSGLKAAVGAADRAFPGSR